MLWMPFRREDSDVALPRAAVAIANGNYTGVVTNSGYSGEVGGYSPGIAKWRLVISFMAPQPCWCTARDKG